MLPIQRRRLTISFWLLVLSLGLVLVHLYQIQLQGYKYARQAGQMGAQNIALEQFTRGEITDRQGVSLSGGYYANRVAVFPVLLDNQEEQLRQLAHILNTNAEQLREQARQGAFYIDRSLTDSTFAQLQKAKLPGVHVLPVYQRYGSKPLAVHITGQLGKISSREQYDRLQSTGSKTYLLGDWIGRSGLEYFYEQQLKGTSAKRWAGVPVDARGRVIQGPGLQVDSLAPDPWRLNVVTTLDTRVQSIVEEVMDQNIAAGAVVVMRAGTGDILAIAGRPGYHPDIFQKVSNIDELPDELFIDQCTALFQPGSVFKVVLAAAALEEGLVNEDTYFDCAGSAAQPVRCWNNAGHNRITFRQALAESCNPAFVELGHTLGAERIIKYAQALGLDRQQIIGYPVPADTRQELALIAGPYSLANSSVGQGPVLVTPVQVTALLNTIAAGGNYYTPRLVSGLSDDSGRLVERYDANEPKQVISPATAGRLGTLLHEVTVSGVGQKAALPGVEVAGKTGSAQVTGYADGKVDAWFAGYVPYENPRYVITVLVREGAGGGETAAPLFREIVTRCLEVE